MRILLLHDKDLGTASSETGGICSVRGGGVAVYLTHLRRGLRDRGHHVADVAFHGDPGDQNGASAAGDHYELPSFRYRMKPSVSSGMDEILAAERPDVIHLHSMPALHPHFVRRLIRARPLVWTFHDVSPLCFRGTRLERASGAVCTRRLGFGCVTCGCHHLGERGGRLGDTAQVLAHPLALRTYRRLPLILVPSRYLADLFIDHGIAEDRIEVVPLFSRFEHVSVPSTSDTTPPMLLFVGRLTHEKGVLDFVRTLITLRDRSWSAQIAGDGPLRDEIDRLLAARGLDSRVRILGELTPRELAQAYDRCSIVVMPSIAPESFGLVGVEAMSLGKPVVAYDAGGIVEWLEDDINGLLVPHRDVEQLARDVGTLLDDPALRLRLGHAGHQRAHGELGHDAHLDRMMHVYQSIVGRTGSSDDAMPVAHATSETGPSIS